MKKIIFACVASALLLAGCGNNNDKEKDNSTETSATITTVATESYSEITEDTVTAVTYETASGITTSEITTTRATHSDRKKETTIIKSTKKQNPANNFSDDTVQEELPITCYLMIHFYSMVQLLQWMRQAICSLQKAVRENPRTLACGENI